MQPKQTQFRPAASSPVAVPRDDSDIKDVLPNGLTLIMKVDRSAPVVSVQGWVKTGSIDEAKHMGAGLSHILEHMLFKGTQKRKSTEIAKQVEQHGGDINAYTSWDRTVFHIDIPKDGGKPGSSLGTEMAVDIILDALMNATLPPDEYKLEQQVILREMAMNRDNPDRAASELLFSTAYTTHPYRHPIIGYTDIYLQLSREQVFDYYKERYLPNNIVFIVVGDIDPDAVRKQVETLTKDWKRKSIEPSVIPDEPLQITAREHIEEMPSELSRLHLAYQTTDFRDLDTYPLDLLSIIAGQGRSSRLYQELREKSGLVHDVEAWSHTPSFRGLFGVSATVDPGKVEAAKDAILNELDRFKTAPVSREELNKAIRQSVTNHLASQKTMSGQAQELGAGEVLLGDTHYGAYYLSQIQKVTAHDIRRVAQKYFDRDRLTTVIVNPKGAGRKASPTVAAEVDSKIQKVTLKNGLTLLTKSDRRLPFVDFRLVMRSGLLLENAENNGVSNLLSKVLLKGTKTRSAEEIVRALENVGGSISAFSGNNSMGISIEVLKEDTALAIDILADVLKNSTFSAESVDREKKMQLAEIAHEKEQIIKTAINLTKKNLFGTHPYALNGLGTEVSVSKLKPKDVVNFYKGVAVPGNMVLAIFGDIDPTQIQQLIEKDFGDLKPGGSKTPDLNPPPLTKAVRAVQNEDKEQAVIIIGYPAVDIKNPDRFAIEVMNTSVSGMGSRLFTRLRDQLALCYYVGVNEFLGLAPGFIYFYIGTEPGKSDEAEKEIFNEIDKVRAQGITVEELAKAKNVILGERQMQRQNIGELATQSALDELYGLGFNAYQEQEAKYQAVTLEDVKKTAQTYLSKDKFVVSIVKPK